MVDKEVPTRLEEDEAIALWQKGRDAWNQWVQENPKAGVSFDGVDFSRYREKKDSRGLAEISFAGFIFPTGNVSFSMATFGDGGADFREATFGDGNVRFCGTTFGDGDVSFWKATFGDGNVNFREATFGDGIVTFFEATFGDGDVIFRGTTFGDCLVYFTDSKFGKGKLIFSSNTFKQTSISMEGAFFACRVTFKNSKNIGLFSFQSATFVHALVIKNIDLNCIVDLRNTSLTNQISLHGLRCRLHRIRNKWGMKVGKDSEDGERLTRLKELAETNKHHEQALAFHADEQRAKRWTTMGFMASCIDMLFSCLCNYGQSISRPLAFWLSSIVVFVWPYAALSTHKTLTLQSLWELLMFSSFNSVPFLTMSRAVRTDGTDLYFKECDMLSLVYPIMGLQGLVSVLLLFLVGLGLRNRFRV